MALEGREGSRNPRVSPRSEHAFLGKTALAEGFAWEGVGPRRPYGPPALPVKDVVGKLALERRPDAATEVVTVLLCATPVCQGRPLTIGRSQPNRRDDSAPWPLRSKRRAALGPRDSLLLPCDEPVGAPAGRTLAQGHPVSMPDDLFSRQHSPEGRPRSASSVGTTCPCGPQGSCSGREEAIHSVGNIEGRRLHGIKCGQHHFLNPPCLFLRMLAL